MFCNIWAQRVTVQEEREGEAGRGSLSGSPAAEPARSAEGSRPSLSRPASTPRGHRGRCSDGDGHGRRRLLPEEQLVLVHAPLLRLRMFHVDCLLAPEYSLSEPWAPGFLPEVLGGPSLHPLTKWVLAHLADSLGRVLICHGIMQI